MLADAEQSLLKFAVRRQPRGIHEPIDAAIDHDRNLLGDCGGDADILFDHEDADVALLAEAQKYLLDLLDDDRSEPFGGLVHDEQMRVEQKRARNSEHLLLAAGKLVTAIAAPLRKSRECFVDALDRPLRPVIAGCEPQMLVDRNRRPKTPALRNVAEAKARDFSGRATNKLLALETNRAACDRRQSDDGFA